MAKRRKKKPPGKVRTNVVELRARGVMVSITQAAEECELDRDTVAKKLNESSVAPADSRLGKPVYRLRDVVRAVFKDLLGKPDPARMDPFRQKAHYQAQRAALELQTEQRELIPRIEVEQEQARILRAIDLTLETLPDVIERDCGATPAQIERMDRAIEECRETLYRELVSAAGTDGVRDSA